MFFIYDGSQAYLTIDGPKLNEVGTVNCQEGPVKLLYPGLVMKTTNKTINKEKNTLFPLLKSNLQKQIRRGLPEAVVTASEMWELDTFELLRRLSIIAAEDVILSLETVNIVWMMAAVSKGFVLSAKMKRCVLTYVYNLTQYKSCRRLELDNLEYNQLNAHLKIKDVSQGAHPQKCYIAGILFRYYFGGLPGDLPMLSKLCDDYLQNDKKLISLSLSSQEFDVLTHLNPLGFTICEAAIDFHIYPKLLMLIEKDTGYSSDLIRATIWECSSRINFRYTETSELEEIWAKIERSFLFHTKTYLLKVLN